VLTVRAEHPVLDGDELVAADRPRGGPHHDRISVYGGRRECNCRQHPKVKDRAAGLHYSRQP
jgi:hypothetical protein